MSVYISTLISDFECVYVYRRPHMRVGGGGYLVVFMKINNIPAVFNIPASHTLLQKASGIMPPLDLLEETPQSTTVLLSQAAAYVPSFTII